MTQLSAADIAGMRATVAAVQLDHTCVIQRGAGGAEDPYGQRPKTWTTIYSGECHWWEDQDVEMVGGVNAVVTRERLLLPAGTDVTTRDRITSVVGYSGAALAQARDILEVVKQLNEVRLELKRVS